jgi:hypothetical protein
MPREARLLPRLFEKLITGRKSTCHLARPPRTRVAASWSRLKRPSTTTNGCRNCARTWPILSIRSPLPTPRGSQRSCAKTTLPRQPTREHSVGPPPQQSSCGALPCHRRYLSGRREGCCCGATSRSRRGPEVADDIALIFDSAPPRAQPRAHLQLQFRTVLPEYTHFSPEPIGLAGPGLGQSRLFCPQK